MEKDENGFSTVTNAAEIQSIEALHADGISLGSLWYSNHLVRGNPFEVKVFGNFGGRWRRCANR
ncbi:MAG: hypothetical protein DRQ49_16950 [Gammaproteobacteria bacterium]|nr:MAG: hypothetical protein DRQ41_15425 [Gammaproteobacteria bacterium]RKZ37019.1 MAG: hypothetical protein DRQ49_16950 [Gammaproteobacteria bacterium]